LNFFAKHLENQVQCATPIAKINTQGYALLCISNNIHQKFLKNFIKEHNLPAMVRKWVNIDEYLISRYEQARINISNVKKLLENNKSQKEISLILKLSAGCISQIIKKNNLK